jgi:hypothetical protein
MQLTALNRWKAAGIHLGLSALIATTVVAVMIFVWYPPPYFDAMGGRGLLKILVGVDVTLGPLLTLIIFKPNKKGLKFDLTVIATLQIAALAYGVWVTFEARPVYTVFAQDRFEVVGASDLDPADLDAGPPEYRDLSLTGPRLIGVKLPSKDQTEEWNNLVFSSVGGKDVQNFPKYYVSYAEISPEVLRKAKPLSALVNSKPDARATVQAFVDTTARPENDFGYVPLIGRETNKTAVIDMRDGQLLDILPIDPY